MDKKIKIKWLKALRSGKFEQTNFRLKRTDANGVERYCCLGVLCEAMKEKYEPIHDFPSDETLKKAGLTHYQTDKLTDMNDFEELSFKQIAAYISRNL